jgi:hypothetical protein
MKEFSKVVREIKKETERYLFKTRKIIVPSSYISNNFSTLSSTLLINKNINTCEIIKWLLDEKENEEAMVLMRFLLERIAFAFKISKDKMDIESINRLQANNCIIELKKSFTYLGLLYGFLSKIIHSHFWTFTKNFTKINKSKKKPKIFVVLYKNEKQLSHSYLMLFTLVFLNLAVAEFITKEDSRHHLFSWGLDKNLTWKCNLIDKGILWKVNNWFDIIDGKPLNN